MNKSFLAQSLTRELFRGSDIVRRFTFKMIGTRDNYALLARANHQLAMSTANIRERSAHLRKKIVLNACHHII